MVAASGEQALVHLERRTPDLLLINLLLPERGGVDVFTWLRSDRRTTHLPLLVTSRENLSPAEKTSVRRRVASLVRRRETGVDGIVRVALQTIANRDRLAPTPT